MSPRAVSSVAILSDIHGMLPPLEHVLAEPLVQSADLIVVTGDHSWGPQPAEVLDRLASLGERALLIRGNADRELLQMSRGQDAGLADDPLSVWGAAQLSAAHQRLLTDMPTTVTLDVHGFGPTLFTHATPRDDAEVVLVDSRPARWAEVLSGVDATVRTIVLGHTHMPFVRLVDGRLVVNPGSVGLPYGRAGAHWALLRDGAVTMGCTPVETSELIDEVTAASTFAGVAAWLDEMVRHPASDFDAIATFGPRDGR